MRPSWHLDAKWLSALAAVALIFAASVTYTLYRLTEHEAATGAFTAFAVSAIEDQMDPAEFGAFMAQVAANPDGEYTVPGVSVTVTGREILQRTPPETLNFVAGQVADALYYEGSDAAGALLIDASAADAIASGEERGMGGPGPGDRQLDLGALGIGEGPPQAFDPSPFAFLSKGTHDLLRSLTYAFALIAVAPMIIMVFFSRRFGRLGSPGMTLLVATAPLALLWTSISRSANAVTGQGDLGDRLVTALSPTFNHLSSAFLTLAVVGAAAVLVAITGHVATWAISQRRTPSVEGAGLAEAQETAPTTSPEAAIGEESPSKESEFPSIGPGGVPQA